MSQQKRAADEEWVQSDAKSQASAEAEQPKAARPSTIVATPTHITLASRRDVRTIVNWAAEAQMNAREFECREFFPIDDQIKDIVDSLMPLVGRALTHTELVDELIDHDVWPRGSQAHCEFMGRVALAHTAMDLYKFR